MMSLQCNKCGRWVDNVSESTKSVTCSYCTLQAVGMPEEKTKSYKPTGRPAGWHFMSEFVDKDGNVSCKIGVLPLFVDDKGNSITYPDVSESDYKELLNDLKNAFDSGDLNDEMTDLEKRKKEADKKAAESRANPKPKKAKAKVVVVNEKRKY